MILNIRGTNGTGKSHLVRQLMADLTREQGEPFEPRHVAGRKRPLYYSLSRGQIHPDVVVLGHYETDCGGCDTISRIDDVFTLARRFSEQGHDVIMEGMILSGEVKRSQSLVEDKVPFKIFHLDIPVQECIDSVNQRRWRRDPSKPPVKEGNIVAKHRHAARALERLAEVEADSISGDRDTILQALRTELCLS